jgi:predicted DCC family thiol-disulfide oxidoreductase YuxK
MEYSTPVLIFDGVCNLCNSLVKFVIRRDKKARIRFASLQSPAGQSLISKAGLKSGTTDTVIYFTDNNFKFRSSAVLYLLRDIGGISKLLYTFIIIPPFIRDFFYNLVARSRYRIFGKRESCMVPSKDIENRFLL